MAGYTAFQTDFYNQAGQLAFDPNCFQVWFHGTLGDPGPTAPIGHKKKKQIVKQEDARDIDEIMDDYLGS